MPLRAVIDGQDVLSPFLSDAEWSSLKKRIKSENLEVRMPCCGEQGNLRVSKRGLKHFYHRARGDCDSPSETWQHLKAKAEVLRACIDANYEAVSEKSSEGWIADVLATKGNVQIAFEIQWSSQTLEKTEFRQKRYSNSRVRCCWLFRKLPKDDYLWAKTNKELPMFEIEVTDDGCRVRVPLSEYSPDEHEFDLYDFVVNLLSGHFRWAENFAPKEVQVVPVNFYNTVCRNCGSFYYIYNIRGVWTSCGHRISDYYGEYQHQFLFSEDVHQNIADYMMKTTNPFVENLNLARIVTVKQFTYNYFGRKQPEDHLRCFGCPECGYGLLITFFERILYGKVLEIGEKQYLPPTIERTESIEVHLDKELLKQETSHWCFSSDGSEHCS